MRRRTSVLLAGTVAAATVLVVGASSTAGSGAHPSERVTLMSAGPQAVPEAAAKPAPAALPDRFTELNKRAKRATTEAQKHGADVSLTVLDRVTGQIVTSGDTAAFPIASVAKLFIADDLLMRLAQKKARLSPRDRRGLEVMLRSSDDFPADDFWARDGGNAIIKRVSDRYKLRKTTVPYNGDWWNTMSTTADLVRYYDMLLDGTGGLPRVQADIIVTNLAASTPRGVDGYPQRFGIPDGLFAEPVAVKQGWMCCWGPDNQVHLSTGVVGPDRRYVVAVASMQPVDEATARNTVTQVLKTMFPGGQI
jgi:hypothetical protein